MSEWVVVTVIIALVGLIAAIVKPAVSLAQCIAKLAAVVDELYKKVEKQEKDVHDSFVGVWNHEDEQDKQLSDHEARIRILEAVDE